MSTSPRKALEQIGANLQKQYERWQPRARYKPLLDPTVEDVKKLCISLRRNAKVCCVCKAVVRGHQTNVNVDNKDNDPILYMQVNPGTWTH